MSDINYTKGRVHRDRASGLSCDIRHESGRAMVLCWGISTTKAALRNSPQYRADCDGIANRFVACWNACDGIPTEVLEARQSGGLPWSFADQIEKKIERDDLLDALRRAKSVIESAGLPVDTSITTAIARATGEQP